MIEVTLKIENLLENLPESARAEVLKRAWEACCDGSILPSVDFDPWDGRHEEKRLEIEEYIVYSVINFGGVP